MRRLINPLSYIWILLSSIVILRFYLFSRSTHLQSCYVCCRVSDFVVYFFRSERRPTYVCPARNGRRDRGCLSILASFATVDDKFLPLLKHHYALHQLSALLARRLHPYCFILHLSLACRLVIFHLLQVVSSGVYLHLTPGDLASS